MASPGRDEGGGWAGGRQGFPGRDERRGWVEERHGFPGPLRALGVWGPCRGPHLNWGAMSGPPISLGHDPAAVRLQHLPREIAAGLGGEEQRAVRDVVEAA